MKRVPWLGVSALLGLLLAQMALSSARKSATFDEPYHLGAGYAYLRTGDPRLSWEHPPLVDALAALPLLARSDVVLPLDHPTWRRAWGVQFGDAFLWQANFSRAPALVWAGRWPIMVLTLALGLALFAALWATAGGPAAWLGLTLFALDPNVVANGRLITTDLGVTCFLFVAVWRLARYLEHPTLLNFAWAGLVAGLALATKFSAVLLAPTFLLLALLYRPPDANPTDSPEPGGLRLLGRRLLALVGIGLLALLVVWAAYGFECGPLLDGGVPWPAPTYWRGMDATYRWIAAGVPAYLFGRISETAR